MAYSKILVAFFPLFMFISFSEGARDILVGGGHGSWAVPSSDHSLNQWAEKTRFKVGDVLIFQYDEKEDSVLQVTKQNYDGCKTLNPIKESKDGNTKIELNHSGPFYFISGAKGHCEEGQKLEVIVLSEEHRSSSLEPVPAPALAPAPAPGPSSQALGLKAGFLGAFLTLGLLIAAMLH